jgi:penicillin-binding protein 2
MGQPTGIDIPGEVADLIPTPEWKLKAIKQQWFLGNTYHYAIGQGDVAVKPLSVNVETSVLSQDGTICLPRIAEKPVCKSLNIDKKKLDLVREGMIEACTTGGTGYTFFDFKPQVACKTGTAETAVDGEPHAWFTVYAPADFPTIVLTVMVERGGEGSKVAGPIATEITKFWFSEK